MKNNELVSIITPSYNSAKFIIQSIESVISQTYSNWEMIIVDDCSQDNSIKIIKEFQEKNNRIKLIESKVNQRPARARNRAIKYANGRYIAFLDSDDIWLPNKLEKQIKFMKDNNLDFTYSSYNLIDEDDNDLGKFIAPQYITYKSMLKSNTVGCLTAIYDTEKLGKVYMPLIRKRQDYGLWLKILKEIDSTKGMLESLATYRILENSVSSNKLKAAQYQWKIYRKIEKLSLVKSLYYFVNYIYYGIKKYR
jgi:glycosyltransferase involved in cell wall biosynthesis